MLYSGARSATCGPKNWNADTVTSRLLTWLVVIRSAFFSPEVTCSGCSIPYYRVGSIADAFICYGLEQEHLFRVKICCGLGKHAEVYNAMKMSEGK
jgi:hypothetical protein